MNNDFASWYLALLRKQVEEEIQFLVTNGHHNSFIPEPCMFCVEHHSGGYRCRRLADLRQFQSSIMSNMHTSKVKYEIGRGGGGSGKRRTIGQELKPSDVINFAMDLTDPEPKPIFQMK